MNPNPPPLPVLDVHVHLAGVGDGGTGCFFHPRRARGPVFSWMRRSAGLPRPPRAARGQKTPCESAGTRFDDAYRQRMLTLAREAGHSVAALAFDWRYGDDGVAFAEGSDFHTPDDYALTVAREAGTGPTGRPLVLAGVSVHPYARDALPRLERAARNGAALVKWLPTAQNIDPADSRCADYYAALVRLGLPLLAHTGSEGATRNLRRDWNNPRALEPALQAGVTLIAAHCGMRSLPHEADYMDHWIAMLPDYPRLHGDTAALFGLRPRRLIRALDQPWVADRLVHGSDWPVPQNAFWFWGAVGWRDRARIAREKNPFLRDALAKRLIGVPEESFTRGWSLVPRPLLGTAQN